MIIRTLIASESQAREATLALAELDRALSSEQALEAIVKGLPPQVISGVRKSLTTERHELQSLLDAYEQTKFGNIEPLRQKAGKTPARH